MRFLKTLFVAVLALAAPAACVAQFAQVTTGPNGTNACPPGQPPFFIADKSSNIISSCGNSGIAQAHQTALATFSAQTAVTAVTTAQTMASVAMPANLQNFPGRTLRLCGYGIYTSPGTTTPTLTFQLTEGGITPVAITSAAVSSTASTNMPFQFCFDLTTVALGAAGTLEAHGELAINITANTPAAAMVTYGDTNTAVSSAISLFAANTLAVQVAASSTITSVQLRQLTVELVS